MRLDEPRNKSVFGTYAFATAAGIHQQGMLRDPRTYEYLEPVKFGRERSLLIARHSGRAVLRFLIDQLGVATDDDELEALYRELISNRQESDCEDLEQLRKRLASKFEATC
jgi:2-isopropylmalate synthase